MTNPGRRLRVATAPALLVAALALAPALAAVPTPAADAADAGSGDTDSGITATITDLTPTELRDGATVTMSGVVTNDGDETWTAAQAYLVIPHTPFTTRQQVSDAVAGEGTYTGERVVELDAIDDLGTLAPGRSVPFRVRVPYRDLDVNGAEGVYPVGVQVLATAEDGTRDSASIARATTFLPLLDDDAPDVPGGIVWPFLSADRAGETGQYGDPLALVERVEPGGQLRHLLDQAREAPPAGTTVVLDPALLVNLDDLVQGRRLPAGLTLTDAQREDVQRFLDDLLALSRRVTTWSLEHGRPDVLALQRSDDAELLDGLLDQVTTQVLARFELSGRRVTWPTRGGTTESLVRSVRGDGERPVVVTRDAVPDWEPRLGSLVSRQTPAGPAPLLVNAGLDEGVPGEQTVTTLRQRLLSEAALGSLERSGDPGSRADAVVLMDPSWDPGPPSDGSLGGALETDGVVPVDLDELFSSVRSPYEGTMPTTATADPISAEQVGLVASAVELGAIVSDLVVDTQAVEGPARERAAELLSVGWRSDREAGAASARSALQRTQGRLDGLSVEGPPAVTLSSSEGSFPLTLRNDTDDAVRVGARISSSNPALALPDIDPVEVAAGERRTLTVSVDVDDQKSATLTAQLITVGGTDVGASDSFNVRSSRVGAALWVAMGAAGVFVLLALVRRYVRGAPSEQVEPTEPGTDDE